MVAGDRFDELLAEAEAAALTLARPVGSNEALAARHGYADGACRPVLVEALERHENLRRRYTLPRGPVGGRLGVAQRSFAKLADTGAPREEPQLRRALPQEASHTARVPALLVFVPDGYLDQAVEETPPRPLRAPPHLFPLVVTAIELSAVEQLGPDDEIVVLLFGTQWMTRTRLWLAAARHPVIGCDLGGAIVYAPTTT